MTARLLKVAILGAGSIGCYIGGYLVGAGVRVCFIGRKPLGQKISMHGMVLTAQDGRAIEVAAKSIDWQCDANAMADCNIILLCTKSADSAASAELIERHCKPGVVVVSMQNGIGNGVVLRKILNKHPVLSAMISFNVARIDGSPVRFHRGTQGEVIIERHPLISQLVEKLNQSGLDASSVNDIAPISWGKLLMNLNNAINVLSGQPLKQQLGNRAYRRVLSAAIAEALVVMRANEISPAKVGRLRPALLPLILRLPEFVFKHLARAMLKMDDEARSSMWEDLQAGREPEIDYLNGAVCALGEKVKLPTPVNDTLVRLVKRRFKDPNIGTMSGEDILARISDGV